MRLLFNITFVTFLMLSIVNTTTAKELNNKHQENYIITYKSSHSTTKLSVDARFQNIPIATAELTKEEVNKLKQDPNIIVERDLPVYGQTQRIEWGIKRVGADRTWQSGFSGNNIKVAILDTGVGPNNDVPVVLGASFVSYTTSYTDDNGHGTHIAGIVGARNNDVGVVGVAPNVEIYAGKVLDKSNKGLTSQVIAGIDWAISNDVDIINLSVKTGDTIALREAVKRAYANGILIVAAAGNSSAYSVDYPAKYPEVIAVGSIDYNNNLSYFSNYGPEIEFVAPGQSIVSSYLNNQIANFSGTSMATPHVVGTFALLKEANPNMDAVELRELMHARTLDLGPAGRDDKYGYGLVDGYIEPPPIPEPEPITPTPPETPQDIIAIVTNGVVYVTWDANTEADLAGYNLYFDTGKHNTELIKSNNITIEGLTKGRSYYIYLTAVDNEGSESPKSRGVFIMVPL